MNTDMASSFSREAWERNAAVYEAIRTSLFNTELAEGVLSTARFKHYITQDAHYLIGFGRALALAAAKAPRPAGIVQFAKAAEVAIVVSVHCTTVLSLSSLASPRKSFPRHRCRPRVTTTSHTSWRRLTPAAEVVIGALLPCFWIYAEVARHPCRAAPSNPYQAWIDTYAGDEFHIAVRAVIETTDEAADAASRNLA